MAAIETTVSCPVYNSFRVQQVAGMFDVPLATTASERFAAELPGLDEPWQIGLVVGPSGSGKTSLARAAYGGCIYSHGAWPGDRAVVDCFDTLDIRQITGLLTAVGFSSPPSWIKPYHALSTGEQFRCDLARALAQGASPAGGAPSAEPRLVVFDEFTSAVGRTVARTASAAVSRGIRAGRIACRFIAVTCHDDVAEWLEPDWTLDLARGELVRGRLRRPQIRLEIVAARQRAWALFGRYHYLNGGLSSFATCYLAQWNGQPVAFCALLPHTGRDAGRACNDRGGRRISRLVVLPDYQGLGIGGRFADAVAELLAGEGHKTTITTGHPAMIAFLKRSPHWRLSRVYPAGGRPHSRLKNFATQARARGSTARAVVSAQYVSHGEKT